MSSVIIEPQTWPGGWKACTDPGDVRSTAAQSYYQCSTTFFQILWTLGHLLVSGIT